MMIATLARLHGRNGSKKQEIQAGLRSSFLTEQDVALKSLQSTQIISIFVKYPKMVLSTGGCSRNFFIPNWHAAQFPVLDEQSGQRSGPDGSSRRGNWAPCQFGIKKFLEQPSVEGTIFNDFWDISSKLKYVGLIGVTLNLLILV